MRRFKCTYSLVCTVWDQICMKTKLPTSNLKLLQWLWELVLLQLGSILLTRHVSYKGALLHHMSFGKSWQYLFSSWYKPEMFTLGMNIVQHGKVHTCWYFKQRPSIVQRINNTCFCLATETINVLLMRTFGHTLYLLYHVCILSM